MVTWKDNVYPSAFYIICYLNKKKMDKKGKIFLRKVLQLFLIISISRYIKVWLIVVAAWYTFLAKSDFGPLPNFEKIEFRNAMLNHSSNWFSHRFTTRLIVITFIMWESIVPRKCGIIRVIYIYIYIYNNDCKRQ